MRIIIGCGGTGGHFYPGYALGKELRARGHEVLFVLRTEDPAAARLQEEDLSFVEIDLRGLPRRIGPKLFSFFWKLLGSLKTCRHLLRAWKPDAVVGMGGYLTFPLAAAAKITRTPLILHESNVILGLANKVCRPWAQALALGLPMPVPPAGRSALTGTPIREDLARRADPAASRRTLGLDPARATLLVFGGSQGASAINRAVPEAAALLAEEGLSFQILHLAGRMNAQETQALYEKSKCKAVVLPYLEDMASAYAAADVALCRSGAATLAELAAQEKPALLIPYPNAAARHQEANARVLESAGAARILLEPLEPRSLAEALRPLLADAALRKNLSSAYARLGLPSAGASARSLADLVEDCSQAKKA
ncbi:MAG: undecaprenyldiphospho-muramoylpentapeptide beta-N-acetylglucosaminyltransferase [Elusimicrobiota bacterium]|jgi:UDP-N-acetylglucosamine--N-acetylmuramyl-(pentapeptide) pyrophosphoryl-undecaprenol N-acetylglucosamine transferase